MAGKDEQLPEYSTHAPAPIAISAGSVAVDAASGEKTFYGYFVRNTWPSGP